MISDVLSIPSKPNEIPSKEDWAAVEKKIGALPNDYYEFLNNYGTGVIDEFIWIFNPASKNENLNLLVQFSKQSSVLAEVIGKSSNKQVFEGLHEYDIVPFGITDNGDLIFWLKSGNTSDWPIVVFPPREESYETFSMSMNQFLHGILVGTVKSRFFPDDFPSTDISFVSL